jgi:GNAT superfamily N-acetyltransferase
MKVEAELEQNAEEVVLRRARSKEDGLAALLLTEQLAHFEQLEPPNDDAKERYLFDGFERQPPRFEVWLAEVAGAPVGYVLIFETYSSFLCKPTLYLEDLFVLPSMRGKGIGTMLLDLCRNIAIERECGRMEWACLDWNTRAQEVYEGMGAVRMKEWLLYRLTGDALKIS